MISANRDCNIQCNNLKDELFIYNYFIFSPNSEGPRSDAQQDSESEQNPVLIINEKVISYSIKLRPNYHSKLFKAVIRMPNGKKTFV